MSLSNSNEQETSIDGAAGMVPIAFSDDSAALKLAEAKVNIGKGLYKAAASLLKDILKSDKTNKEAYAYLGQTRLLQRRFREAIEAFEEALALDPEDIFSASELGLLLHRLGEFSAARARFEACLSLLSPDNRKLSEVMRRIAALDKDLALIESLGVELSLDREQMASALYRRGNELAVAGEIEEAVSAYSCAALCRPDYSSPDFELGKTIEAYQEQRPTGKHLSCKYLEGGLHFHEDKLRFCCTMHSGGKGWTEICDFYGGSLPVDTVLAKRLEILKKLDEGVDNPCMGCHALEEKEWEKPDYLFDDVIVNNYSVCNFRCNYCSLTHRNFEMPAYYYMSDNSFDDLLGNGWLAPDAPVTWGGGDPSVSKEFQPIAEKLIAHGCSLRVNTNAAIEVPVLSKALEQDQAHVCISVDSGLRSKFYEVKFNKKAGTNDVVTIKNKEVYDAVWDNIAIYCSKNKNQVVIKYIFMETNSSPVELKEFIDNCVAANVLKIHLTPEATYLKTLPIARGSLPDAIYEGMCFAANYARENGFLVEGPQTDVPEIVGAS